MTMTRSDSKFSHHTSCPKCGSHNNLAVYEDGTGYCFTLMPDGSMCGYKQNVEDIEVQLGQESYAFHHEASFKNLPRRGISKETCEHYRVTYADRKLYFPMYFQGSYVGCKYRTPDKQFRWIQSSRQCKLFGLNTIVQFKKTLIITEGELDALAVHQMYQGQKWKHNVVSIVSGASGAVGDISTHIEYLSKFEKIYLCFDNDDPGRTAAKACMDLFDPGKAYLVELPPQYKDPNEMLLVGAEKEFFDCVQKAVTVMPKGMLTDEEQVDGFLEYLRPENCIGVSTGFRELDEYCGGLHRGELYTVVAGTGVGKTRFVLDIAYNVSIEAEDPIVTYFLPLEMPYEQVLALLAERMQASAIISDPEVTKNLPFDDPEFRHHMKDLAQKVTKNLKLADCTGDLSTDDLELLIKSAVRTKGARLIIIDHKDQLVSFDLGSTYKQVDNLMARMQALASKLKITIIVVSQQSRDKTDKNDTDVSIDRIRNSQGVSHNSSFIIGLRRPRDSEVMECVILKSHRIVGRKTGIFLLRRIEGKYKFEEVNSYAQTTREEEVPESVREECVPEQQALGSDVRTEGDTLSGSVRTGLLTDNEDGETDIHRDEGEVEGRRQKQTNKCKTFQSRAGLEDLVSKLQGKTIPKAPFSQLRLVGD